MYNLIRSLRTRKSTALRCIYRDRSRDCNYYLIAIYHWMSRGHLGPHAPHAPHTPSYCSW